jgi:hypothetical protein
MQSLTIAKPLEGDDLVSRGTSGEQETRADGPPVQQHGASATRADPATLSYAPELESVAQHFQQGVGILDHDRLFTAVEMKSDVARHDA